LIRFGSRVLIGCLAAVFILTVSAAPERPDAPAKPAAVGSKPGQKAPNFTLEDIDDNKWTLYDLKRVSAVVLYFCGTECPLANRYIGRLNELNLTFLRKNVLVLAVNPNGVEPVAAIRKHAKDFGLTVNVLLDRDQRVADSLGVELTPTAIVLDSAFRVRYRGMFDDNPTEAHVKKRYVRAAVQAILNGEEVDVKETEPWGCMVQRAEEPKSSDVTYRGQIAALLQRHCVVCHRAGESGPFSLVGYDAARRWAKTAALFARSRRMPPWRGETHGLFRDERTMSDPEIALLSRWAAAGAPRGEGPVPPEACAAPTEWALGKPDLLIDAPEYTMPAAGDDVYRCFVLSTGLEADAWVRGVEVRPGNKQTVRHVTVFTDSSGTATKRDAAGPGPGYATPGTYIGFEPEARVDGWAPGRTPTLLPDGVAWRLRRSARIVLQVHYHPTGRKETDRTRVALYFAKKPARQPLRWLELANKTFQLAAGRADQRVTAELTVPEDIHALAVAPHMHYMGRQMRIDATYPDGKRQTLLHIKDWDFHWQETYHFKAPHSLPKGTRLHLEVVFDTSLNNPNTPPDLPKTISWGARATDEMCVATIAYYRDAEDKN
jgi:peroxiredoxin